LLCSIAYDVALHAVALQLNKAKTTFSSVRYRQWRSRGERGQVGGTSPGAQALGEHQHTFFGHLKTRFKQKFRPKNA